MCVNGFSHSKTKIIPLILLEFDCFMMTPDLSYRIKMTYTKPQNCIFHKCCFV